MRFSVTWAASAPAYTLMAWMVIDGGWQAHSLRQAVDGVMPGLFLGAAFGLLPAAVGLVIGAATAILFRGCGFSVQFAAYAAGSAALDDWLLHRVAGAFREPMAGFGMPAAYWLVGAASLLVAWVLMRAFPAAP